MFLTKKLITYFLLFFSIFLLIFCSIYAFFRIPRSQEQTKYGIIVPNKEIEEDVLVREIETIFPIKEIETGVISNAVKIDEIALPEKRSRNDFIFQKYWLERQENYGVLDAPDSIEEQKCIGACSFDFLNISSMPEGMGSKLYGVGYDVLGASLASTTLLIMIRMVLFLFEKDKIHHREFITKAKKEIDRRQNRQADSYQGSAFDDGHDGDFDNCQTGSDTGSVLGRPKDISAEHGNSRSQTFTMDTSLGRGSTAYRIDKLIAKKKREIPKNIGRWTSQETNRNTVHQTQIRQRVPIVVMIRNMQDMRAYLRTNGLFNFVIVRLGNDISPFYKLSLNYTFPKRRPNFSQISTTLLYFNLEELEELHELFNAFFNNDVCIVDERNDLATISFSAQDARNILRIVRRYIQYKKMNLKDEQEIYLSLLKRLLKILNTVSLVREKYVI